MVTERHTNVTRVIPKLIYESDKIEFLKKKPLKSLKYHAKISQISIIISGKQMQMFFYLFQHMTFFGGDIKYRKISDFIKIRIYIYKYIYVYNIFRIQENLKL